MNLESWSVVFYSIEIFRPLIEKIFQKENIKFNEIKKSYKGTNANFVVDNMVIKIFTPVETGEFPEKDMKNEIFGLQRAFNLGISVPKVIAHGMCKDKYDFYYIITEYIEGILFKEIRNSFSDQEKYNFGKKIREMTDKLNTPCEEFNDDDLIQNSRESYHWNGYSLEFKRNLNKFLDSYEVIDPVYVHGDIHDENLIISKDGSIYLLDFADGILAPILYEQALIASDLFHFEKSFMLGYFGEYDIDEMTDICFKNLLIHECGCIVLYTLFPKDAHLIDDLQDLKQKIHEMIEHNYNFSIELNDQT